MDIFIKPDNYSTMSIIIVEINCFLFVCQDIFFNFLAIYFVHVEQITTHKKGPVFRGALVIRHPLCLPIHRCRLMTRRWISEVPSTIWRILLVLKYRDTEYSFMKPYPPWIWKASLAQRSAISEEKSFA